MRPGTRVLAAVLAIAAVHLSARQPAQPGTAAAITEESIRGHMEFLAGDAMNGRGSGTRDEWMAAEYIASHLRRGGLGSHYFAESTPLGNVIANLQFEMIGRPDPKVPAKTLWLTGYERSTLGPELATSPATRSRRSTFRT